MIRRTPSLVVLVAVVLVAAACSGSEPAASSTTSTAALPTTTTSTTVVAPTTTTTPPPPQEYAIVGNFQEGARQAIADVYNWMAADPGTLPRPDAPRGLLAHLEDADPPRRFTLGGRASVGEMPNGDKVAVARVGGDIFLLVRDEGPWRVAGAHLEGTKPWLGDEPRLLLVIGSDARIGQDQQRYRADSIHVVGLPASGRGGTILGFPRDSFITAEQIQAGGDRAGLDEGQVPSYGMKWTNLMASRGPEIMLGTAQELTGLDIEGYVITGFQGYQGLIRSLGGLMIDLPKSVYSANDWDSFAAGVQTLSPVRALQLARIRKGLPRGDFDRSFNQGLIMLAGMEMAQDLGIEQLPSLLELLHKHAWTDLDTESLLTMAAGAFMADPDKMTNLVLDGRVATISGASVVLLDEEAAAARYADLGEDGLIKLPVED